jgi:hypothetical protein
VARGKKLTGIIIRDQATLDATNVILLDQGAPLIKGRPINDVTASGVNATLVTPPFSNSGIQDAIALISSDCYMIKVDVTRFFHQFPLAEFAQWLFWF